MNESAEVGITQKLLNGQRFLGFWWQFFADIARALLAPRFIPFSKLPVRAVGKLGASTGGAATLAARLFDLLVGNALVPDVLLKRYNVNQGASFQGASLFSVQDGALPRSP